MKDERESGLREILNLGHTVGRAIETVSDYRLLHGEAVSIGMAAQVKLANRLGYVSADEEKEVITLLKRRSFQWKFRIISTGKHLSKSCIPIKK